MSEETHFKSEEGLQQWKKYVHMVFNLLISTGQKRLSVSLVVYVLLLHVEIFYVRTNLECL